MNQREHPCISRVERWQAWRFGVFMLTLGSLLHGCVSDATLLQENSAIALRSARVQARKDLQCQQTEATVLSEREVPGAPWGYLYSDYRIRAEGCGRSSIYDVECRDERLCEVTRESK